MNSSISSVGLCLPSLLRREKMPGYANKQGAPTLNEVNIFVWLSINPITIVSHAPVIDLGGHRFSNIVKWF